KKAKPATKKKAAAPKVTVPKGYASHASYAGDFRIALPKGWLALPKNHSLVKSLAKGQFSSGYKLEFVAYDPKGIANGYATDCIVLKGVGRGAASFTDWVAAQISALKDSLDNQKFHWRIVWLPGGRAIRVSYHVAAKGGKQVWALTYLYDELSSAYSLSCSASSGLQGRYQKVFDATARTFRLTG